MTQLKFEKTASVYRHVRTDGGMFVEILREGGYQRIAYCPRPQKPNPEPALHYH